MSYGDVLTNYSTLLTIRRKGAYRNTLITGGFFFLFAVSTLGIGILEGVSEPSMYLIIPLLVLAGTGFGMAYARHEMIKEVIALADELTHADRERDADHA